MGTKKKKKKKNDFDRVTFLESEFIFLTAVENVESLRVILLRDNTDTMT